jgi:hypothetical protein
MDYRLDHPHLLEEDVYLRISWLFGNPELYHNGSRQLEKATGTNIYSIKRKDGKVITLALEPKRLDPFPRLEIEGNQYPIGRKLFAIDYLFIVFPLLLIFIGGALGGLLGFLSAGINARIMRMPKSAIERYGLSVVSTVTATFVWFVIAVSLSLLFNGQQ